MTDKRASLESRNRVGFAVCLIAATVVAWPANTRAKTNDNTSWRATGLVYVGGAPLQMVLAPGIELKHVYHRDRNPLWDNLQIRGAVSALATPTSPGAQVDLEWMPLLPVILRARYSLLFFTGLSLGMGPGMGFDSASDPFDGDTLSARKGEEEAEVVQRAAFALVLRAGLWRLFATNELELAGWYVPGSPDEFWYELYYDSMVARGRVDGTLANKSMLLFQAWKGRGAAQLLAGAVNEYSMAFGADIERDRLGGIVVFTPSDELLGIDQPTFIVATGVTTLHRHRKNELWVQVIAKLNWDL